jgi:hypothetical protein
MNGIRQNATPIVIIAVLLSLALIVAAGEEKERKKEAELSNTAKFDEDLAPDLSVLPPHEFMLERRSDGIFLKFSVTYWNRGDGPLELINKEVGQPGKQSVYQRIYQEDGSFREKLAGAFVWSQSHRHYHFRDFSFYTLTPENPPNDFESVISKTTFCIRDTDAIDPDLPNAPTIPQFAGCSIERQGVSVGWGDTYDFTLPDQEFDVTNLPSGRYQIEIEVDPKGRIVEISKENNRNSAIVFIDKERMSVEVIGSGETLEEVVEEKLSD